MTLIDDLRHDLVEKKLWPVAAGMAAAAAAVPVVFGPDDAASQPPAPATPSASQPAGALNDLPASAPTPRPSVAVAKNVLSDPFATYPDVGPSSAPSGPQGPEAASPDAQIAVPAGPSGPGDDGAGDPGIVSPAADASAPQTQTPVATSTDSADPVEETSKVGAGSSVPDAQPWKARLVVGASRKARNYAASSPLPSANDPAFVLLGLLPKGRRAVLLLADDVTATGGRCMPSRKACQTLELRPGQKARLRVMDDDGSVERSIKLRYLKAVPGRAVQAKAAARKGRGTKAKLASRLATGRSYWLDPSRGTLSVSRGRHRASSRRHLAAARAAGGRAPAARRVAVGQSGAIGAPVTGTTGTSGWVGATR